MKSLKIWSLVMLLAMAFVGCDNDVDMGGETMGGETPTPVQTDIVGKWHLTSYCGATPEKFKKYLETVKNLKLKLTILYHMHSCISIHFFNKL